MHQGLCILEVIFHHILTVIFHRIGAGAFVEDDFDGRMVPFAVFYVFDKIQLITVIHDLETLDILEFHHIGQIIDNKDVIPALVVQAFHDIAADKTGTTGYNDHSLPSFTSVTIFSTSPVVE